MGCLVARKDFAEANKEAVDTFLTEYEASTAFVNEHTGEAAQMVAANGIMADAALAEKAIPGCNIVYLDGRPCGGAPWLSMMFYLMPTPKLSGNCQVTTSITPNKNHPASTWVRCWWL